MHTHQIDKIVELGSQRRLVLLHYRKGVTSINLVPRLVEPYNFTQGKQDLMVRCYQLEPHEGWRFFMLHKIDRVEDGGNTFRPRTRIRLQTGEVHSGSEQSEFWTHELQSYRDMVGDALADGRVTREELRAMHGFQEKNQLTIEHIRFVHASIFHRCLGAIIEDGVVDASERAQIRFLHNVLKALGWSILD